MVFKNRHGANGQTVVTGDLVHRRRLIDVNELIELVGVSVRTVYRMRASRKIPEPVKVNGTNRWRLGEILDWIDHGCPPMDSNQR